MKLFKRNDMRIRLDSDGDSVQLTFYILGGITITVLLPPDVAKQIAVKMEEIADHIQMRKQYAREEKALDS